MTEPAMTINGIPIYVSVDAGNYVEFSPGLGQFDPGQAPLAAPPTEAAPESWHQIRPPTAEELTSVYEAWAGTFRKSRSAGCIPNHLFNEITFTTITGLLQRGMQIRVLTARSHPEVVLAWVAFERDSRSPQLIVHYAFTKEGFRERGLCNLLLSYIGAGPKFIYTHQTGFSKYWPQAHHNPGIARRKDL